MKKIFRTFVGLLALATIITSCNQKENSTSTNEKTTEEVVKTENVKTQKIELTEIERDLDIQSTLLPYEKISVSPTIQGHITKLYVEVGDKVSAGQMLVKMDENTYLQTKLNFENLKTNFDRISALNESDNISKQTYDQTKSQYEILKTSLANIEANTYVKAPFAGVISARSYEDGDLYTGAPIYQLIQVNTLKALVDVPESYIGQIKKGLKVNITAEAYGEQEFPAVVEIIYPTVDASSHTFQVQLKIENGKETLHPGMYIHAKLNIGKTKIWLVPYQAVLKLQGANDRYVFINENGIAKRVNVQLGERFNDKIEIITEEIKEGDEIVVVGQAKLVKGTKLNVME